MDLFEQLLTDFVKHNPRPCNDGIVEHVDYTIQRLLYLKISLKKQKLLRALNLEYGNELGNKYYNFLMEVK
jgi:hypothetical protein